jgi:hypothetical protein
MRRKKGVGPRQGNERGPTFHQIPMTGGTVEFENVSDDESAHDSYMPNKRPAEAARHGAAKNFASRNDFASIRNLT